MRACARAREHVRKIDASVFGGLLTDRLIASHTYREGERESICEEDYPLLRCSGVEQAEGRGTGGGKRFAITSRNEKSSEGELRRCLFCYLWLHYRKRRKDSERVRGRDAACKTKVCIKWRSTFLRRHAELNPAARSISSARVHRFLARRTVISCPPPPLPICYNGSPL